MARERAEKAHAAGALALWEYFIAIETLYTVKKQLLATVVYFS